jgi:hypothetical protein
MWGHRNRFYAGELHRSLGWVRSDFITEMSPGLLVSDRHSCLLCRTSRRWKYTVPVGPTGLGLWLQEVSDRRSWWPPLHLYRPLGCQEGSRLGGWSNHWPLSYNTQSENSLWQMTRFTLVLHRLSTENLPFWRFVSLYQFLYRWRSQCTALLPSLFSF